MSKAKTVFRIDIPDQDDPRRSAERVEIYKCFPGPRPNEQGLWPMACRHRLMKELQRLLAPPAMTGREAETDLKPLSELQGGTWTDGHSTSCMSLAEAGRQAALSCYAGLAGRRSFEFWEAIGPARLNPFKDWRARPRMAFDLIIPSLPG